MTETVGDRIMRQMKARGVKNPAVAAAAGVHPGTVSKWRHDERVPEEVQLERVAAFLGVSTSWLRYGENTAESGRTPRPEHSPPASAEFPADGLHACAEALMARGNLLAGNRAEPASIEAYYRGAIVCRQAIKAHEELQERFLAERTQHSAMVGRLLAIITERRALEDA